MEAQCQFVSPTETDLQGYNVPRSQAWHWLTYAQHLFNSLTNCVFVFKPQWHNGHVPATSHLQFHISDSLPVSFKAVDQ
jgi:hypothetical protein